MLKKKLIFLLPIFLIIFSCDSSTNSTSIQTLRFCGKAPDIISRVEWNARHPADEMDMLVPMRLIIHHTAITQDPDKWIGDQIQDIQAYHMDFLGFPDILYHFYIDIYGNIAEGRELQFEINRLSYDSGDAIHIALEGNFENEFVSDEQFNSLDHLMCWLSDANAINPMETYGHRELFETLCPGENLFKEIDNIIVRVIELLNE